MVVHHNLAGQPLIRVLHLAARRHALERLRRPALERLRRLALERLRRLALERLQLGRVLRLPGVTIITITTTDRAEITIMLVGIITTTVRVEITIMLAGTDLVVETPTLRLVASDN